MKEGAFLAVWLSDGAARILLGILKEEATASRWCALGYVKAESHVGVWLEIDTVQQRQGPTDEIVLEWQVKPRTCLVRWDFITHAQSWGEAVPEKKQIGFIRRPVEGEGRRGSGKEG